MSTNTFSALKAGYEAQLARMTVTRKDAVDQVARKLVGFYHTGKYGAVSAKTGIPIVWIAASFEREASSNFKLSPAQGDPWNKPSVHVPAHRGPFPDWPTAALDAYHIDGLDKIGAGNWSWALCCYYGELFNGFGYRDPHAHVNGEVVHYPPIPSPYLWGGTSIQQKGKYVRDGVYDPSVMDVQLGIIPIMKRMIELEPALDFAKDVLAAPVNVPDPSPRTAPAPAKTPVHPGTGPAVAVGVGLVAWLHNHIWLIALIGVATAVVIYLLHRKAAPPLSPKAIEPASAPPGAAA